MKFQGCIDDAAKAMGPEIEAETRAAYEDAYAQASQTLSPDEADREAGRVVLDALERQSILEKQRRALAVRARRRALEGLADYKTARGYSGVKALGGSGGKPPKTGWDQGGRPPASGPYHRGGVAADFLKEVVDGSGGLAGSSIPSVKGRYQAIMGSFEAMMVDVIEQAESATGLPVRGKALFQNVVREAFGEDSGDQAAKALAHAWSETAEHARKLFNAAGGSIGKIEKWGLPQTHDHLAVRGAGKDGWVEAILPLLDRSQMKDNVTGRPFSEKRLKAVLGDVHDTIVTQGAIDREVGDQLGKGMLAKQRSESRFLVFRDANSWMAYQSQFGRADPYSAMMNHLDSMARDIGRMQVLGPNPDQQLDWMARLAANEIQREQGLPEAPREGWLNHADGRIKSAREMYRLFVGDVAGPFGSENVIGDIGAGVRAGLSGVQLGSAVINDITSNPVMAAQTRAFVGLSKTPNFKGWMGYVLSSQTRKTARRTGLIFDRARDRHAGHIQKMLRAQTVGQKAYAGFNAVTRLLPNAVHQLSGLELNRNAQRFAFQSEFMGRLADWSDRSLAAMANGTGEEKAFAATLKARGITPADWEKIRSVPADEDGFLTPRAIGEADQELGWKVSEMIERETRNATPEPLLWAQAQLMMGTDAGSIQGELVRSMMSYRSFTVTQTYAWSREFIFRAHQAGLEAEAAGLPWQMRAAMMAGPLMVGLTIAGAASVWMKDIDKGNDPRPLWDEDDPEVARKRAFRFLGMAMAQGGGQGILGDFLSSVEARNGKSAAATAFGPAMGMVSDTYNLTFGNANEALAGEESHFGKEAVSYVGRYNPLASLWWSRTAFDRAVIDQIQRLVDPDAEAAFQRKARRMERETGQGQWWPEGQVLPERAPNMDVTGAPMS